ncbi:dUTP diphosphatase [Bacillus thuringiensis]|nr:dUTP diphosphatase [Bacillus thuringiensis]
MDGFHFILPLRWYIEYDRYIDEIKNHYRSNAYNYRYSSLTRQFIMIYDATLNFAIRDTLYKELFTLYLCLGDMLGFIHAEIGQAYMKKNEVNHKRQDNEY